MRDLKRLRMLADLAERVWEAESQRLAAARAATAAAEAEADALAAGRAAEATPAEDAADLLADSRWRDWSERAETAARRRAAALEAQEDAVREEASGAFARTRALALMTDRAAMAARREARRRAERDGGAEE